MSFKQVLAQRLIEARRLSGASQTLVAETLGTTPKTLYNWEHAKTTPSLDEVEKLAACYCVEPYSLFQPNPLTRDSLLKFRKNYISEVLTQCASSLFSALSSPPSPSVQKIEQPLKPSQLSLYGNLSPRYPDRVDLSARKLESSSVFKVPF